MAENRGKVEGDRKKSKIAGATANVKIQYDEPKLNLEKGFVRFTIRSGSHWLYLFDHRPETFQAVTKAQAALGDISETTKTMSALADTINQPAKVLVMEKEASNGNPFPYLVLLPTNGRRSSALLTVTQGEVTENKSLWSWQLDQKSSIIALTDQNHPLIVDNKNTTTYLQEGILEIPAIST